MTVDRIVHLVAGLMVLLGLAVLTIVEFILAPLNSAALMFVIMILKAQFCPLAFFLKKAGVKEENCCS